MQRIFALLAVACSAGVAVADPGDWLAGAKHTYIVLPTQSVTDGDVKAVSYSQGGAYLLVAERPIIADQDRALQVGDINRTDFREGPISLLVWDRLHRQIKVDWTSDDSTVQIDNVHWIHGTPTALLVMHSMVRSGPLNEASKAWGVMALNAETGQFQWISGLESLGSQPTVIVSPSKSAAVVAFDDRIQKQEAEPTPVQFANRELFRHYVAVRRLARSQQMSDWFDNSSLMANKFVNLDPNGRVIRFVTAQQPVQGLVWSADGSRWLVNVAVSKDSPTGLNRVDENGFLQPVDDTAYKSISLSHELNLGTQPQLAKRGKTEVSYTQVWLVAAAKGDHAELLLTPNGSRPLVSPVEDSVFYCDGGVSVVRRVLPLSPDQADQLRKAEMLRAEMDRRLEERAVIDEEVLRLVVIDRVKATGPPAVERP